MSVEEFKQYMIDTLCDSERTLTADEVAAIEAIEATYLDEEFILGKNPRYSYCSEVVRCRAGELSVVVELRRRLIESIELKGDFFALRDYADELNSRLKGKSLERTAIQEALNDFDTEQYIKDLTTNQLIDIIFTETIK